MKKTIATIIACSCSVLTMAQLTAGKIAYKETIKLDIQLAGEMAQFADMIPKEQTITRVLYFSQDESVYKMVPQKKETPTGNGNATMLINSNIPDETIYKNAKENKLVGQREFMGRKFLVTGDLKKIDWKITGQQKTILNYPCQQAIAMIDTQKVTVWFTPAIQASTGPNNLTGLPGLILEVDNGKNHNIIATEVEAQAPDVKLLARPTDGKRMSSQQYEAMMAEKMKEMQEQYGGGNGNVIIRVQNR